VGTLANEFTWSTSRDAAFRRCARQYWWQYYGSWGGWERDAPPEAREAYRLKNLSTRWAWVGTAVHEAIESILRRLHAHAAREELSFAGDAVDPEAEVEAMTRRMRAQFLESRRGEYRQRPKQAFGLAEHEYAEPVDDEEWRAMSEKAREALRGWLASETFREIRESDPGRWFPIEELGRFDFEGTPVWAVLDFALRGPEGSAVIYDWKTGAVAPEANRAQLVCYALFLEAEHGVAPERVITRLVYLGREPVVHEHRVTPADVEEAKGLLRASIAAMRGLLAEPGTNRAERASFPMTDDLARCAVCVYRRLCGR
jgi:CRISPR/Cas system-associated exonuclease Cas4 (RecB family)